MQQARLAHAGIADDRDDTPSAGRQRGDGLLQQRQLGVAPHQRQALRFSSPGGGRLSAAAQQFVCLNPIVPALQLGEGERTERKSLPGQAGQLLADQRLPRQAGALQAVGQIDRGADDSVLSLPSSPDPGSDDLSAGHADVQGDLGDTQVEAQFAHALFHCQRGAQRPFRVIFVGGRRAKDSHQPVASVLVDVSALFEHGFGHLFQTQVDQFGCLFGVQLLRETGKASDVSKEHNDKAALAAERRVPAFRQCIGQVGAARAAEGEAGGILETAMWAEAG